MKKLSTVLCALAAAGVLWAYEGPTFTVAVWRGETTYAEIPDNFALEMMEAMRGMGQMSANDVTVDLYGVRAISYTTKPRGAQLASRLDCLNKFDPSESNAEAPSVCRVAVAADARPGVHDFGPLQVKVIDRVLPPPSEWKYYLDLWQHPWASARFGKAKPFSDGHFKALAPVLTTLAECGQKVLTTTLLDLPWNHQCYDAYHSMIGRVKKPDGSWSFDYAVFDRYVEFGKTCGIGPDIACYTMCPWGYVVRWENEKGEIQRMVAKPGTPAFEDYWGDFLVDFAKHLKEKGWFEHTFIAMDERSPEDVKNISELIQRKVPDFRISMAGNRKPSDFKGIKIDNYCQVLADVTPEFLQELEERRAKGFVTTYYVCCSPLRPNTFMTSENDEAFWLGVFPALSGFDGFLRWAANSWPADPYGNAAFGYWSPGDTFLIYPNGEYSTRLLNLRAGIVAAEKLRLLKEQGLFSDAIEAVRPKFDYKSALDGKTDHRALRKEIENLVNR